MTTRTGQEVEFSVSYEGDALAQNTMDVRDLAPALLALGQSFERANSLFNGDRASISLRIRATKPGSFEIGLFLQQVLEGATDVLSGDLMVSAFVLKELLIGGGDKGVIGLLQFLKHLGGKKPQQIEETPDGITFEAENVKEVKKLGQELTDEDVRDVRYEILNAYSQGDVETETQRKMTKTEWYVNFCFRVYGKGYRDEIKILVLESIWVSETIRCMIHLKPPAVTDTLTRKINVFT